MPLSGDGLLDHERLAVRPRLGPHGRAEPVPGAGLAYHLHQIQRLHPARRVINWLYERALIDYDDPSSPTQATLTKSGMAQATALVEQARLSAGAP